jgi:hypothetical protein
MLAAGTMAGLGEIASDRSTMIYHACTSPHSATRKSLGVLMGFDIPNPFMLIFTVQVMIFVTKTPLLQH